MNQGPVEGERTISEVAKKKVWLTPKRQALALSVVAIAVVGFVFWKNPGGKKDDVDPPIPATGIGQAVHYDPPKPEPMHTAFVPATVPPMGREVQTPPAQPLATLPPVQPPTTTGPAAAKTRPPRMLSYSTEASSPSAKAGGGSEGGGRDEGTHVAFKGTQIAGAKAGPALDMDLMLMPGLVMCVLDVAIDSTLPGPIMCHLQDPVMSPNHVVLMGRGTKVMGSYTSEVKQGQGRLMAVTATAFTPEGVPVPLGGPFSDGLGRSGLGDVSIDNKYPERFGAAVLLTLTESALGIAQASVSKSGNSYVSLNSGGSVSSLGQEVLRQSINIPPQITKNQGDVIGLWILQPISFKESYRLISNDRK